MPLAHDPFQRIINVHWAGGGVFIAGDLDSNIYYLKLGQDSLVWQKLGKLDFHKEDEEEGFFTGRVAGSSFANIEVKDSGDNVIGSNPVFVLVGGSGYSNETGIIMASGDGLNWSRVFDFGEHEDSDTYVGAGIFGVVWDAEAKKFYAGGHQVNSFADNIAGIFWEQQTDLLFQSSDGYHWSETNRHEMRIDWTVSTDKPPYPEYKTGLLAAHCSDRVKDKNDNRVPDGNYGHNETLLIAPSSVIPIDYLFGIYINDIPTSSSSVTVKSLSSEGAPSYPTDVGIPVTCTAMVAGKWMAAGGVMANFDAGKGHSRGATLVASDDEYIWERLDPKGTNIIVTMIGGAIGTDASL